MGRILSEFVHDLASDGICELLDKIIRRLEYVYGLSE